MTTTVKQKSRLMVPANVQRLAGIKAGDRLEFRVSGGIVNIVPILPTADKEYTPKQRKVIDAGITESLKEYDQGLAFGPFSIHEEFIASLNQEASKLRSTTQKQSKNKRPLK